MSTLILLSHGQSTWNLTNRFTGTEDVDLSMQGEIEASRAAALIRSYPIDMAYTSVLRRAIHTLQIILQKNNIIVPVIRDAALNERDYGDLQGRDKLETEHQYGTDQIQRWRRSFAAAPPNGESLAATYHRVVTYYKTEIETKLMDGQTILIVAHGNSLRALMMYLEGITASDIEQIDIASCVPKVYEFTTDFKMTRVEDLLFEPVG